MPEVMGFEGVSFYGTAGSTASTQILIGRDTTIATDHTRAPTTVKGTGAAPPLVTEDVVAVSWSATINLVNDDAGAGATVLAAFRAAAAAGTPVALRMKDHSAGMGFDGDVTMTSSQGEPLAGEQTMDFTCTPTKQSARAPQFYV